MQYGLIGEHLPHSFSKDIHGQIGSATANEYEYEIRELSPDEIDAFMVQRDFKGINVTIPYKQTVIPYLDHIDDAAKKIGAVNTIVNRDGKLYGYNTDYYGLKDLILNAGIDLKGKKTAILGTGGTSKTATAVSGSLGADKIIIVSRHKNVDTITYDELYTDHADTDVIINTTPVGMYPNIVATPVDINRLNNISGVTDVIYNPLRTVLMQEAEACGIKSTCGLRMLVTQAVYAYKLFMTDVHPADPEMIANDLDQTAQIWDITDNIYKNIYDDKLNIVLTGMPGSGKSTIGRMLADKTGKTFVDTDAIIVERENREISDIFASDGEGYFRDVESSAIADISGKNGLIIATGGGAILRPENVKALKANGTVVFLDRPLKDLIPTDDRPTALNTDMLKKRYEERYDIYKNTCDIQIANDRDKESVIKAVIEAIGMS